MEGLGLPPWDELKYFNLPTENTFNNTTPNTTPIAQANPNRVLLIIATVQTTATINVSTKPGVTAGTGFALDTNVRLELNAKDHPQLCQAAWYANIGVGMSVTVIEVILNSWPVVGVRNARKIAGKPLPGPTDQDDRD